MKKLRLLLSGILLLQMHTVCWAQKKASVPAVPVLRIALLHFPDSAYIDEAVIRLNESGKLKPIELELDNTPRTTTIALKQNNTLYSIITHQKKSTSDTIPLIIRNNKKDIFFIRLQGRENTRRHVYIKDYGTTPLLHELSANTHFVCHYNPADTLPADKRFVLILSDEPINKRAYKPSVKLEEGALYSAHYDRKYDQIHVKMGIGKFLVTISDEMGFHVFEKPIVSKNGLVKIGASEIKNGLYLIKMVDVFGNCETARFIKY